jgi:hypothetical protein
MESQKVYRVWRLRKQSLYVDAQLREVLDGDAASVEVRFLYNGELSYARRWPSREAALADADSKRAELEREGWIVHW